MAERRAPVTSADGLHARPAALFVRAVSDSGIAVQITKGGDTADARSILAVLGLDIRQGDEILLSADGPGAEEALDRLVTILNDNADADA